jgi:hypothetical protein
MTLKGQGPVRGTKRSQCVEGEKERATGRGSAGRGPWGVKQHTKGSAERRSHRRSQNRQQTPNSKSPSPIPFRKMCDGARGHCNSRRVAVNGRMIGAHHTQGANQFQTHVPIRIALAVACVVSITITIHEAESTHTSIPPQYGNGRMIVMRIRITIDLRCRINPNNRLLVSGIRIRGCGTIRQKLTNRKPPDGNGATGPDQAVVRPAPKG